MAGRVVEEVGEHLTDQEVIDVDEREVVVDRHGDAPGRRDPRPRTASVTRSPTAIGSLAQLEGAGLDPAQVEQVGHEAVEPVGLVVDERQKLLALLRC